ncbi:MAG: ferrochelatase [Veillonella sp.]|nr:ferrochelatase [Veillonella sp.]
MSQGVKKGLLYLSYGTPRCEEDLIPYLTSIRGRIPTEAEVDSLRQRYDLIGSFQGGLSPLNDVTSRQGRALVDFLNAKDTSSDWVLYEGYKHLDPSIEDAVFSMAEAGIREAVAIVAAPFYSSMGTADYGRRAQAKAAELGVKLAIVDAWWQHASFLACWQEALKALPEAQGSRYYILAAHSIPAVAREMRDPYVTDIEAFGDALATSMGLSDYQVAWQSAPPRGQWLTPKVDRVIEEALAQGFQEIVLVPIGFITEHLEVLYDDDVVYREKIEKAGATYYRPMMPNDREQLVGAMASAVDGVKE